MFQRTLNLLDTQSFFLFGARGTGKTYYLTNEFFKFRKHRYINLLLANEFLKFSSNPDELLNEAAVLKKEDSEWIVIDEVQKVPKLLDVVHYLIESKGVKFGLTGSSARKLKRGGANLLAGRAFLNHLFPLSFIEIGESFNLQEVLEWGSLPRILTLPDSVSRQEYLDTYTHSYLKEEIGEEQIIRKLEPFIRFLEVAAQCNGTIINYAKIADDTRTSPKNIQSYFSVLEDTLLGFCLEPYHQSVRKRQRQNPKFYLFDLGVQRAMSRMLNVPLQKQTYAYGKSFEHFIILEIYRLNSYLRRDFRFSYLTTKDGAEIDLIIERPTLPNVLVEIKSSSNVMARDLQHLNRFSADFKKAELICLSQDVRRKRLGSVEIIPWQEGIRQIFDE